MSRRLAVAYSPVYLKWRLGEGHPTNPERARIAVDLLERMFGEDGLDSYDPAIVRREDVQEAASQVHDPNYVMRVIENGDLGDEAEYSSLDLADAATAMFGGTMQLTYLMEVDEYAPRVYFNPQGAKHHAMWDRASGFCALNDMAWAALRMTEKGRTVGYLDWDAHHGDGVEALCRGIDTVTTYSIHQKGIFPGTGLRSAPEQGIFNHAVDAGSGDRVLLAGVRDALKTFEERGVDTLLLAAGADGLREDPLSRLIYTQKGLCQAAHLVGAWSRRLRVPVLVGGAGGYRPLDETPKAWAGVVGTLHRELTRKAA